MEPDLTQAPDAQVVAWMIDGGSDALAELMRRYGGALGAVLRRATSGAPDWEDLAQETWLRVIRFAPRYDPTYAFSTWLFRIAWNLAMDRAGRPGTLLPEDAAPELVDEARHPEALALGRERAAAVRSGIRDLPSHLAEAILLRHFEELSEREMAARLGIPPGTVKSRLHHAHRRLADLLGGI